jgi:hypothetical protein
LYSSILCILLLAKNFHQKSFLIATKLANKQLKHSFFIC